MISKLSGVGKEEDSFQEYSRYQKLKIYFSGAGFNTNPKERTCFGARMVLPWLVLKVGILCHDG
jgi:hypothetical protein